MRETGAVLGGLGLGACTLAANLPLWAALGLTTAGFVGCRLLFQQKAAPAEPPVPRLEEVFLKHQRELSGLAGMLSPPLGDQIRGLQEAVLELQQQLQNCSPEVYAQGYKLLACLETVLSALHQFKSLSHRLDGEQGEVAAGVVGVIHTFTESVRSFNRGLLQGDIDRLKSELQVVQESIQKRS